MAGRKRGTIQQRGEHSFSIVLDLGEQPWRKCPTPNCKGSVFTDSTKALACERCGAPLAAPISQRRREWHSGYTKKAEANKALTEMLAEVDKGVHVEPTSLTLREYVEKTWRPGIELSDLRATTKDLYLRTTTNHILPGLGSILLRELTPARLVQWLTGLKASGTGARTVELSGTVLHKILASALDLELIARNAADNKEVRRARGTAKAPKPTIWNAEQTRAFLDSQRTDRLYPLWRLAVTTGLRRGELSGLRWGDIDLDKGSLKVRATRVVVGWEVVDSGPKTEAGIRTIALDPATVAALKAHRTSQAEEMLSVGRRAGDDGFVFTANPRGDAYHPTTLTRALATRAKAAGLPPIRLHALRHGHATSGLASGVPLPVMSKRLGHASIRITADTYLGALPALDQAAADQVASLYDEPVAATEKTLR